MERKVITISKESNITAISAAKSLWYAERRKYRLLLASKRESFWRHTIQETQRNPKTMWKSINTILGRGQTKTNSSISANEFHKFLDSRILDIRSYFLDAPDPEFRSVTSSFSSFRLVTAAEVNNLIRTLPDKQCTNDPIPTSFLKAMRNDITPFLVNLFNQSLSSGIVPKSFKIANITPILKRVNLDISDTNSYRPISNLPVLSKLLERLVAQQLIQYLKENDLFPKLQSAYRTGHSTETAVLKVLSDILMAVDSGNLAVLAYLDLSAAFDMVDQGLQNLPVAGHIANNLKLCEPKLRKNQC